MYTYISKVMNQTMVYKLSHLSSRLKKFGLIYLSLILISSYLFLNIEPQESSTFAKFLPIVIITFVATFSFLITVNLNYDKFLEKDIQKLSIEEIDFFKKLELKYYININVMYNGISSKFKNNDKILFSDEVKNYVSYLKNKTSNDNIEIWIISLYDDTIKEKQNLLDSVKPSPLQSSI